MSFSYSGLVLFRCVILELVLGKHLHIILWVVAEILIRHNRVILEDCGILVGLKDGVLRHKSELALKLHLFCKIIYRVYPYHILLSMVHLLLRLVLNDTFYNAFRWHLNFIKCETYIIIVFLFGLLEVFLLAVSFFFELRFWLFGQAEELRCCEIFICLNRINNYFICWVQFRVV